MTSSESPYRFEDGDGYSTLVLSPELSQLRWADVQEIGDDVLNRLSGWESPAFLVDLSALDYMDSATVALIVRIWKSIKDRDGRMVVVNQHQFVLEVLTLAGLHKVWSIVETREEALQELGVTKSPHSGLLSEPWLGVIGALAFFGGGCGVVLLFFPPGTLEPWAVLAIAFGCSAVGLIAGTLLAVRQRALVGVFNAVFCLALIVTAILKLSGVLG